MWPNLIHYLWFDHALPLPSTDWPDLLNLTTGAEKKCLIVKIVRPSATKCVKKTKTSFEMAAGKTQTSKRQCCFMYFRGLCTDSTRKSPTHNSTRPSQGLPVKPQWTSCAQFGHSLPGPSGHFAVGLSSRMDRNLAVWLTCGRKALYTHKAFSMERPQYRKPLARKAVGKGFLY